MLMLKEQVKSNYKGASLTDVLSATNVLVLLITSAKNSSRNDVRSQLVLLYSSIMGNLKASLFTNFENSYKINENS